MAVSPAFLGHSVVTAFSLPCYTLLLTLYKSDLSLSAPLYVPVASGHKNYLIPCSQRQTVTLRLRTHSRQTTTY